MSLGKEEVDQKTIKFISISIYRKSPGKVIRSVLVLFIGSSGGGGGRLMMKMRVPIDGNYRLARSLMFHDDKV